MFHVLALPSALGLCRNGGTASPPHQDPPGQCILAAPRSHAPTVLAETITYVAHLLDEK